MAVSKARGRWRVDFRFDGRRYRRNAPENSRRGAEAYELYLKQKLMRGESLDAPKETKPEVQRYGEYAEFWMKTYAMTNNKPSEVNKKRQILDTHLLPFFGGFKITEIDTLAIERYKSKKITSGLSPKTINNHLTTLRRSLSCAKDWGYIDTLPKVNWLKAPPSKIVTLSRKEQERLLEDDQDPLWDLVILMGLRTGMRIGEMLALHWEDVDFQTQQICVRYSLSDRKRITSTKNNRIRYIPISNELYHRLVEWKKERKGKKGDLVFGIHSNVPYLRQSSYDAIRRICKRANVSKIGWHVLRHTFATELCARAVPLRAVQTLLGHSSITMTERYAHVGEQTLQHAVAVLEGEFITFGHYMGTTKKEGVVTSGSWSNDQGDISAR